MQAQVNRHLKEVWGFTCTCIACTDCILGAKLAHMRELDRALVACSSSDVRTPGGAERFDDAILVGESLIKMYDELGYVSIHPHSISECRCVDISVV